MAKTSQKDRVIRHLRDEGTINPMVAIRDYGIYRLAAVIHNLRQDGYNITSENVSTKNRYGESTHYAKYHLTKQKPVTSSDYARAKNGY